MYLPANGIRPNLIDVTIWGSRNKGCELIYRNSFLRNQTVFRTSSEWWGSLDGNGCACQRARVKISVRVPLQAHWRALSCASEWA